LAHWEHRIHGIWLQSQAALAATMLKVAFTALTGEIEIVEVVMVEFGAN
jgi:hypothetical protein